MIPTTSEVLYFHAFVCVCACSAGGDPVLGLVLALVLVALGCARPEVHTGSIVRAVSDAPAELQTDAYRQGSIGVVVDSHPDGGWLVLWTWTKLLTWCRTAELAPDGCLLREQRHAALLLSAVIVAADLVWWWS